MVHAHVWRGTVPSSGGAIWNDVSGSGAGRLPDIPVNALVIEPSSPNTMYIGTDIGVFRTTDGGTIWTQFSHGLPNIAVFDMRLYEPTKLLRVVTHGRGMWERKLGVSSMPDVNIYVRDHIMDSGRISPSSSTIRAVFEDELHSISLGQELNRLMCADIKIDALEGSSDLSFQIPNVDEVDYVIFESKLKNHIPQRGRINRVYVQVHNRGIQAASSITVKLLYADASAQLPQLPPDFWTLFPADSTDTTNWKPIGSPKIITSLSVTEPVVLEFDWSISTTAC